MNITDIAKLAGVSPSTVSKVMNGRDSSISSETRRRVLETAKKYHYQPYSSVLSQGGRTLVLGVIVRDVTQDARFIAGILEATNSSGYSLLLEESGGTEEGELRAMAALVGRHVDGIIWDPLCERDSLAKGELEGSQIPAVTFGAGSGNGLGIDFERIGYAATEALVKAGHTAIACVTGEEATDSSFASGYRRCLFDHGLPQREDLASKGDADELSSALAGRRFTAAVTSRHSYAAQLCELAKSLHYSLPHDLSLVSSSPSSGGEDIKPACSVVRVPLRELGREAVRSIIGVVEGGERGEPSVPAYEVDSDLTVAPPFLRTLPRVVSVGSINIDNYLSFDVLPRAGASISTSRSSVFPGGKCANEAVGVAKLGLMSTAVGFVGDDSDADVVFGTLAQHGVDATGVSRAPGMRTGQAYIFVDKTGDSMISIMSGANDSLSPDAVMEHEGLFRDADACLLQTEVPIRAVEAAASVAKRCGAMTVVKPSACGRLPEGLLAATDVLAPNLNELGAIVPGDRKVEEKAAFLLDQGVGTVVVTMGPDGCTVFDRDQTVHIAALDVVSVDDTGAGDAFVSAFVTYLLLGYDKVRSARMATYAAGLSTTRQGVIPALVDRETLEAFVAQREPELLVR